MSTTTVLHVNWASGSLWVWGERTGRGAPALAGVASAEGGAARHPGAVSADELVAVLGGLGVSAGAPGEITLALPTVGEAPLPSPRLAHATGHGAHEGGAARLEKWTVDAAPIDPADAPAVMERLVERAEGEGATHEFALGPGAQYFALVASFARSLLAEQRFVPMLWQHPSGDLTASWRPWLGDEATAEKAAALLRAMPPAARAAVDESDHQPWTILERALDRMVDSAVRRLLVRESFGEALDGRSPEQDPHVAWLAGLLADASEAPAPAPMRPNLLRGVRQWIGRLDERGAEVGWRLLLRVEEPEGDVEPKKAAWRITFHLQAMDDAGVVLDADEIWSLAGDAATVDGRRIESARELLLAELGRASRLFETLEKSLDSEAEPTGVSLTTSQAYAFLRETRPLLIEQGFGVDAPAWWDSPAARLGVRLEIESGDAPEEREDGPPSSGAPAVGLQAIVDYRWRIAVGDTALSMAEFEKIAGLREPLVRVNGRWVEIRPEDVKAAAEFLSKNPGGKIAVGEALRLAYAAESLPGSVGVLGLSASGWVARVFGDDDGKLETVEQPGGFIGSLRPYQLKGLSWLAFLERFGLGACLADDMGLGKTIQLLALLLWEREGNRQQATGDREGTEARRHQGTEGEAEGGRPQATGSGEGKQSVAPTLLVAPTSVVRNWIREAARFAPSLTAVLHHGPERLNGDAFVEKASSADLVVTTYALANRDQEDLSRVRWGRVVLDEAQNIKNPAAKQTQALRSLTAERRVALTGTPVENRLSELWSIMEFCNRGYLGPLAEFKRRFSVPIERRRDPHKGRQLRSLVRPFVLRRLKTDPSVTADLPEKIQTKELTFLTAEQASLYEATVRGMLEQVDKLEGMRRRGAVLAALIRLKQICNHPASLPDSGAEPGGAPPSAARSGKSARLMEMLEEVLAAKDQALIFTQFRRMGHLLSSMIMHDLDKEALFLHGGVPAAQREQMVERFQRGDGSAPIFILSLKAGGLGMNLTAANHVFHYDRWWNPAVENQATDRAHRIGQTRTVHVHKFVVSGTLEERIDQMLEQKTELAESIIASGERWLTELSTSQLRDLLTLREGAVMEDE